MIFRSEDPHLWIDAAYNMKGWLEADRDWSYFEFGSTEDGSIRDEGEGKEETKMTTMKKIHKIEFGEDEIWKKEKEKPR